MSYGNVTSIHGKRFGLINDGTSRLLVDDLLYSPAATVTAGSTSATISNNGITTLNSTGAAKAYTMAAPVAGVHKVLTCTAGSTVTGAVHTVTLASGTFDGTNHIATLNAEAETITLVGLSSTAYAVIANVGSVALSTS